MKRIILPFLFISFAGFCQDPKSIESIAYQTKLDSLSKTLIINTNSLSYLSLRKFKKEIDAWDGKMLSTQIDTFQKKFIIVHNLNLKREEMDELLKKYNIKKSAILSYN